MPPVPLCLVLLLALQGPPLQVTASVDRTRVQVGEELVYSLRAVTAAIGSFRVELPQIDGLETVERSERTDRVIAARPGTRVFVLELRLRASDLGTWRSEEHTSELQSR